MPNLTATPALDRRSSLIEILSWARPHDSETEKRFCGEFLDRVPGMERDAFGNRMLTVGDKPARVMWSCHVDTVAQRDGPQLVAFDPATGIASLAKGKPGMSLGADDGAGLWIMLHMIAAQRPGLYVFHRGEERGCLGSTWIRKNNPALLAGLDAAIAFDRAGHADVITHQAYGRTCSDAFAKSLGDQLNRLEKTFAYVPDDTGVYTDTNEYAGIVPECTNLSVGYHGQHGPRETLDIYHCERLLDAMLAFDFGKVTIERDPSVPDVEDRFWGGWEPRNSRPGTADPLEDYAAAVETYPFVAAELLLKAGIDLDKFMDESWGLEMDVRSDESRWDVEDDYRPLMSA